jgi:hypothetical protein
LDDHDLKVLETYELKVIVAEVTLTCAAAEGYCNRGETNPWPQPPGRSTSTTSWRRSGPCFRPTRTTRSKGEQRRMRESVKLRLLTKDELKILRR